MSLDAITGGVYTDRTKMRLTYFTIYSVRVLLFAAAKNNELSKIKEISELYGLSNNHLMKVVHHLGKGGYLQTVRGKNGGFRIGKTADEINLGELIRYTEEKLKVIENLEDENNDGNQAIQRNFDCVINEAMNAFFEVVDRYTIADLL